MGSKHPTPAGFNKCSAVSNCIIAYISCLSQLSPGKKDWGIFTRLFLVSSGYHRCVWEVAWRKVAGEGRTYSSKLFQLCTTT